METIAELVESTRRGNREAFAVLVSRYERVAVSTAWSVIGDFHLAQDVAQDGFIIAFEKLESLANNSAFGPWLLAIVRREAIRKSKSMRRTISFELVNDETVLAIDGRWQADHAELIDAISRLPDHEHQVVVLFYLDGHSANNVASMLDRKIGTVTKQLSRAVGRLRDLMEVRNESA